MSESTHNNAPINSWNEGDSATFIDFGEIFVPKRTEQIETLLQLIPARTDEPFTIVELAAGGGVLAQAILEHFPCCHYVALDGSAKMRKEMAQKLASFHDRRAFSLRGAGMAHYTSLSTTLRRVFAVRASSLR